MMNTRRRLLLLALAVFAAFVAPTLTHAQAPECVNDYLASIAKNGPTLGISASDADQLVARVKQSIGLQRPVLVVPCQAINKAFAWVGGADQRVPDGEYIIYNPDWVREMIGKDQVQAVALFGHELGHILNGDFIPPRKNLNLKTKEADADHFAGCAVAKMAGDFSKLEDLLNRLRLESDSVYPDRLTSIKTAREGFDRCATAGPTRTAFKPDSFTITAIGNRFERASPGIWYELAKDKDDPSFVFKEKSRTEAELMLYDESRNLYLRLPIPAGIAQWRVGEHGPWTYWYVSTYHH